MIDFEEIEKEIIKIESSRDTSYATMERLAPLYCAMMYKRLGVNTEAYEPQAVNAIGDSEFLLAVSGKDSTKAWAVMNELMDDLMIGNKRVYDRVMDKLRRV